MNSASLTIWSISPEAPTHSNTTAEPPILCSARTSRKTSNTDRSAGSTSTCAPKPVRASSRRSELKSDKMIGAIASGQCRHRGQPDGTCTDDDGYLTRLQIGGAHVELADREGVDDGDGITGDVSLDDPRGHLRHDEQLAEAALRLGMLTDDAQPASATVHQPDRHRRHTATDREGVAAAGPVADDLADELVTHHDVAFGVVQRASGGVVDPQFRVIHEVDVGGTDRRAEGLESKSPCPGTGSAVSRTSRRPPRSTTARTMSLLFDEVAYSRYIRDMFFGLPNHRMTNPEGSQECADPARHPPSRVLDVVELLSQPGESPMRFSDIVRELDLTQATAHSILKTLSDRGWVTRDPMTKAFALGPALSLLAARLDVARPLTHLARDATQRLVETTGMAASVVEKTGDHLVITAFAQPRGK